MRAYDHDTGIALLQPLTQLHRRTQLTPQITITAEKGRLTAEEIERMIKEAEEFAETDKLVRERVDARNRLEAYAYNV